MTAVLLKSMLLALVLTLMLELPAAAVLGVRGKTNFIIVILANTLTNPAVNCIHSFCRYSLGFGFAQMAVITALLEISAFVTEWLVYKKNTDVEKPFRLSLCCNAFSYLTGLGITAIIN
ncbi:MAG: hypothetical protein IJ368_03810 [Oscillospiraceae bacterium]|nr:hypothetical protein [Oscillospiraceae bacterium]